MRRWLASSVDSCGPSTKSCSNPARDFSSGHRPEKSGENELNFCPGRILCASFAMCLVTLWGVARGQTAANSSGQQWHSYGHDKGGQRFSPLKQINRANVGQLQRAWTYKVPAFPGSGVVAFGSHYPFFYFESLYWKVRSAKFPHNQELAICEGNAQSLLKNRL